MNLKSWLRRYPQPSELRLDRKQLVHIGEGKTKWRDVLDIIEQTQPAVVEALSDKGVLLRSTELAHEKDEDEDDDKGKTTKGTTDLAVFAKLLADAYSAGAAAHAKAYELAFTENTKLVQVLSTRLGGLEQAWQKTLEQRAEELANQAESDPEGFMNGPLAPLVQAFMAKQLASGGEANGKANGKAAKK